jgi:hypothetical protein
MDTNQYLYVYKSFIPNFILTSRAATSILLSIRLTTLFFFNTVTDVSAGTTMSFVHKSGFQSSGWLESCKFKVKQLLLKNPLYAYFNASVAEGFYLCASRSQRVKAVKVVCNLSEQASGKAVIVKNTPGEMPFPWSEKDPYKLPVSIDRVQKLLLDESKFTDAPKLWFCRVLCSIVS